MVEDRFWHSRPGSSRVTLVHVGTRRAGRRSIFWTDDSARLVTRSAARDCADRRGFGTINLPAVDSERHTAAQHELVCDSSVVGPRVLHRREPDGARRTKLAATGEAAVDRFRLLDARCLLVLNLFDT